MNNLKAVSDLVKLIAFTMWVLQGSNKDPGDYALLNPSKNSTKRIIKVDKIPIIYVYAKE
jgi:hypothetical protein